MTETLDDVKRFLEAGIKSFFPFYAETIATLREARRHLNQTRGRGYVAAVNMGEKLEITAQRLENRLNLYEVKIDSDCVYCDAFTVSPTVWAGVYESLQDDGLSEQTERIDGWLVEFAKPIGGTRQVPPDVDLCEVAKFTSAAKAAIKVVELLMLDHLAAVIRSQTEANEHERMKQEANEVF